MTRDTFFRILSLAFCAVILLGCSLGLVRTANYRKAKEFLREYYGDTLIPNGMDLCYASLGAASVRVQLGVPVFERKPTQLRNAFKPADLPEFTMTVPASVHADDVIPVTFTSTLRYPRVYDAFFLERKIGWDMYTVNRNTKPGFVVTPLPKGGTLELTFPLEGRYPPGEYRLVAQVTSRDISAMDKCFLAAEFVIE